MFRLILTASRQWQRTACTGSSYLLRRKIPGIRRGYCFRQEPLESGLDDTLDTATSGLHVQEFRWRKPFTKEMYKTRSKLREHFQRTMKAYKLESDGRLPGTVYELIKACASGLIMEDPNTKVAAARELFTQLKEQGAPLDTSLFNVLLKVYVANDHPFSPSEFLEDMTDSGVSPNQGTFNLLIEAYCHQGNLAGATNLIEHIKALNLPIWENVYANLVTAHARSGDITGAEGILDVMKENGHLPGMNSYTALFCAFAEKGDLAGIERVYEEMQKRRMFPGVTTYIKVIDSLSKFNHPEFIPKVLNLIRNKQWIIVDLRALTCALVMRGEIESSLKLLDCLKEFGGLSTLLGRCFVRGMIKNGSDLQRVLTVISDFHDNDQVQVSWMYKELLYLIYDGTLSRGNQRAEDILAVIRNMQEKGVEVRTHYIYPALAHYSQDGNMQGVMECIFVFNGLTQVSFDFLQKTLKKTNISIVEYCQAHPGTEQIIMILVKHLITHQQWSSASKLVSVTGAQMLSIGDILRCIHRTLSHQRPLRILEVVDLYKALCRLEPHPQLVKSIELTAKSLALQSQHTEAHTFLCQIEDMEGLELPKSVYEVLLYGFELASQAEEFYRLLVVLKEKQVEPSIRVQKEILKMAAILRSEPLATHSMKVLEDHATSTSVDLSNFIQAIAQKNFSTALVTYKRMRLSGHVPTYLALEQLISSSLMHNLQVSEELLSDAASFGYTLRLGVKNAFIEQYSKRGDVDSARAMVAKIISDGQVPTNKTYQRLMEGYAYHGDAEAIRKLIEEHHLTVDRFMLSHLVMAYLNSNRYVSALKVLEDYPDTVPLLRSLTQLIKTSLKDGYNAEDIEKVKGAMDHLNFTKSSQCEIVFNLCLETGQIEGAWQEMQKEGFVLHHAKFLALCKKLINRGQREQVEKVLKMLQRSGYHKVHKDHAASILAGYGLLDDPTSANNIVQELKEAEFERNKDLDVV